MASRVVDGIASSTGSSPSTTAVSAPPRSRFHLDDHPGDGQSTPSTFIRRSRASIRSTSWGSPWGGMIAEVIARSRRSLVRKMIIAGTGPAGGEGIDKVTGSPCSDTARAARPPGPKQFLFFTRTPTGAEPARGSWHGSRKRTDYRDKAISVRSFRALKAINRWGRQSPADLASIHQPRVVINGESDKMVPTATVEIDRRTPTQSARDLHPDAGTGALSGFHGVRPEGPGVSSRAEHEGVPCQHD